MPDIVPNVPWVLNGDMRVAEIVDQAGEASAGDWTTPNPPGPSKKVGGSGPPLQVLQPFEGLKVE
jgi:hypothetical protein